MATPVPNMHERWMSTCDAVNYLTPAEFCFPGTHDSGAYQAPDFHPICSDNAMAISKARLTSDFQKVATRWTITQPGCSIYCQLMNGVRSLDLRVARTIYEGKEEYYLIHTYAVCKLSDAINDIKRFVAEHPTEMVLMTVLPYYQCDDATLQKIFEKDLGQWLVPNVHGNSTFLPTESVRSILGGGHRIVGQYRYQSKTPVFNKLWFSLAETTFDYHFKGEDNVQKKQKYLVEGLTALSAAHAQTKTTQRFDMGYTLTESTMDVIGSLFSGNSLAEMAGKMNKTLHQFVIEQLSAPLRKFIGILAVDCASTSSVVDVCIFLNEERKPKPASETS